MNKKYIKYGLYGSVSLALLIIIIKNKNSSGLIPATTGGVLSYLDSGNALKSGPDKNISDPEIENDTLLELITTSLNDFVVNEDSSDPDINNTIGSGTEGMGLGGFFAHTTVSFLNSLTGGVFNNAFDHLHTSIDEAIQNAKDAYNDLQESLAATTMGFDIDSYGNTGGGNESSGVGPGDTADSGGNPSGVEGLEGVGNW